MAKRKRKKQRSFKRRIGRVLVWILGLWVAVTWLVVLVLRWVPPPTSAFMIERQVRALIHHQNHFHLHYHWVAWQRIAPVVPMAMITSEDQKFPFHHGFDVASIHDAITDAAQGERLRGASTISQQTAKNLFLWGGRSFVRKGLEAYFTVLLEVTWPKQRIIEVYVNIVELGNGIYGIDAASRVFFHEPPDQISEAQATTLAAVLPNPRTLHADRPSDYVRRRAAWITRQMHQLGGTSYLDNL